MKNDNDKKKCSQNVVYYLTKYLDENNNRCIFAV